ncbi:MAG: Nif3-like dinuclear metal center hexameric protein [Turicibacter sp.]|nr:Nif3-like dinuclear metal center hexameric protein [Turicibacter sp.]
MLLVKDVVAFLEEKFPPSLAYEWDNIGLQLGDIERETRKILIALDATTPVVDEAVAQGVDLIVTHHPFIFSPVKAIDLTTPQGKNIAKLVKHDITVYSMHTNYDIAPGGMNDVLARKLGLQNVKPFAMVDEVHGLGRVGDLDTEWYLDDWTRDFRKRSELMVAGRVYGGSELIRKVAVIGGSGADHAKEAKAAGADVLVTGDVTYHKAVEAQEIGLSLVDIDHYAEVVMQDAVRDLLKEQFAGVEVVSSTTCKNPIG